MMDSYVMEFFNLVKTGGASENSIATMIFHMYLPDSFSITLMPSNGFAGGGADPDLRCAGAAVRPPRDPRAKWAKSGFLANSSEKSSS